MGQKHTRDSGNSMSAIPPIVRNIYICPGGAQLTSTGNIDQGHIVYYRASKSDCSQCSLKPKCTTATARKITRDLNEDVRDRVRAFGRYGSLPAVLPRAQEARDASCAHEAHSPARPVPAAGLERRQRRSATDCNCAKPEAAGQASLPRPANSATGQSRITAPSSVDSVNSSYRGELTQQNCKNPILNVALSLILLYACR